MKIVSLNNAADLDALEADWNRLCEPETHYVPSFAQLCNRLRVPNSGYRLLAAIEDSQVKAIACFVYSDANKRFEVATRKLFELKVRDVSLFGSCMPGASNEEIIRQLFQVVIDGGDFDVISLGEIFVDSPLYRVITTVPGIVAWRVMRQTQLRWMIRLPATFDEYFSSLRQTARKHIGRDYRRFERQRPELRVVKDAAEVEAFLRDAERISRRTYQWNISCGIANDEKMRRWYTGLARMGVLRCYLVYIDGVPCAFGAGELSHRTFSFLSTGYDPEYRKLSAGTGLILRMVRDLIENTNCAVFDFWSGGEEGYKSRLGNFSPLCARMQMAPIYRPYSLALFVFDRTLTLVKNAVLKSFVAVFGRGALKQRLKSMLRPFGIGSY